VNSLAIDGIGRSMLIPDDDNRPGLEVTIILVLSIANEDENETVNASTPINGVLIIDPVIFDGREIGRVFVEC